MNEEKSRGFYEDKGFTRRTIILTDESIEIMNKTCRRHKITQSEFIKIILTKVDLEQFSDLFDAKRAEKDSSSEIVKKFGRLSPEQIAAISEIINK